MKCISLWQPYATLMVLGAKRVETRSWGTSHRGTLLIHATAKFSTDLVELCHEEPFKTYLRAIGIMRWQDLPQGQVLGHVQLIDCKPIVVDGSEWREDNFLIPAEPERSFGKYEPGRFAWLTEKPTAFRAPIPYKARQRIFNVHPEALGLR